MYEVNYSGRTSYVSNYFYCCIQVKGLLYDAECDLSAIADFLVDYFAAAAAFKAGKIQNNPFTQASAAGGAAIPPPTILAGRVHIFCDVICCFSS